MLRWSIKLRRSATLTARIWRFMNTVAICMGLYAVSSLQGPGARGMSLLETSSFISFCYCFACNYLVTLYAGRARISSMGLPY